MAQVPYSAVPNTDAQDTPTPNLRLETPGAAFGSTIASALEHVGAKVEHAGDEIFQRAIAIQNLRNETEAKEADAEYMTKVGEAHAQYGALEGKAAVDAYPGYVKSIQDLRKSMREGLSNDASRKMFDGSALATASRTIFNGAGHAASENKRWAANASAARAELLMDTIFKNPTDDLTFKRSLGGVEGEVHSQADLGGWSEEQTANVLAKTRSAAWARRIVGLSKTAPFEAQRMLTDNKGDLTAEDFEKVEGSVRQQGRVVGSRMISADINKDLLHPSEDTPEKSLEDRITEGRKEAKEKFPDDPLAEEYVTDRIRADWTKAKAIKKDFDQTNRLTVEGALVAGMKDGKVPTTLDELMADPAVGAAFDALPKTMQRSYMKVLANNAKGDRAWTNESLKQYATLDGMRIEDPEKFLEQDIPSEVMPFSAKKKLIEAQNKLKAVPEQDPRVMRALGVLAPALNDAGLTKAADPTGYYHFIGTLADEIQSYQNDHKKSPPADEVKKMGARLLQQVPDKTKYWFNKNSPFYDQGVPEETKKEIENLPIWAERGVPATEDEVRRVYLHDLYRKLYPAKKDESRVGK